MNKARPRLAESLIVGLIIAVVPALACTSGADVLTRETRLLMGTMVEITVAGAPERLARKAIGEALVEMERVEGLTSSHRAGSLVSRMNREAHEHPIPAGSELLQLLRQSIAIGDASAGAFDVTVWPLSRLWDFESGGRHPTPQEIAETVGKVGYKSLKIDHESGSVGFDREGMALDLGAIAKGYAVDRGIEVLLRNGVRNAIIDAGGDLRVLGSRPGKGFWRIGVQHPREPGSLLMTFDLKDTAIVTSGDYERFFLEEGVRYHHILDPATGMPARGCQSVTVLAPTAAEADACATAAFVLGPEKGLAFLRTRPGVRGVIVDAGGGLHWSDDGLERMARR